MLRVYIINNILKPIFARSWLWLAYALICAYGYFVSDYSNTGNWIFALFALGLFAVPHALGDFFLIPWILNPPWERKWSYWFFILIAYFLLAALFLGIWTLSPSFAIALITAFVIWHFGSMDSYNLFPGRGISWVIASMGRGLLVLSAPFYFRPLDTLDLLLEISELQSNGMLQTLYSFSYYLIVIGLALTLLAPMVNKFAEGNFLPKHIYPYLIETLCIVACFKFAPPLVAGSFYFLIAHSIRQIKRSPVYIPEQRNAFGENTSGARNVLTFYDRIRKPLLLVFLILATLLGYQVIAKGLPINTITIYSFKPLAFLLLPHLLVAGLVDFNPRSSRY